MRWMKSAVLEGTVSQSPNYILYSVRFSCVSMSFKQRIDSKSGFEELFLNNYRELFQLGFGLIKQKGIAMDALQAFFVNMVENTVWDRNISDMKGYLFRSFYHHVIKELKQKRESVPLTDISLEISDHGYEKLLEESQTRILLQNALEQATKNLPAQQQRVLRLKYQEGMDYKEIAEITGRSSQTIYNQIHQAVGKLRLALKVKK